MDVPSPTARFSVILLTMAAAAILVLAGCSLDTTDPGRDGPSYKPTEAWSVPITPDSLAMVRDITFGAYTQYPYGIPGAEAGLPNYRYRDVGDHRFLHTSGAYEWPVLSEAGATEWRSYSSSGLLTLTLAEGAGLSGRLVATGLKPNFAYQVKLQGQPTTTYPWSKANVQDRSNAAIGSLGRYWCVNDGWNVPESQLRSHRGHWVLGYLLVDFLCTDIHGNAVLDFAVNGSYHVLWREDQRAKQTYDSASKAVLMDYTGMVYDASFASPATAQVYAEYEPGRPAPGTLVLPDGDYKCRLMLTEESFHNGMSGYPSLVDGGFWAHGLSYEDIGFAVGAPADPVPTLSVASINVTANSITGGRFVIGYADVVVTDGANAVGGVTVSGEWKWNGSYLCSSTAVTSAGGLATEQSAKVKTSQASTHTFTFTVTSLTKQGYIDGSKSESGTDTWP